MCAQYEINHTLRYQLKQQLNINQDFSTDQDWQGRIYPYSLAPVVRANLHGELVLSMLRYSITPNWSKIERPKFATYNARLDRPKPGSPQELEYIFEVPSWRNSFRSKHCLVVIGSFIESCTSGLYANKMVKFAATDGQLLVAAGIWDSWLNPETRQVLNSFALLTDEPTEFLRTAGHDRSPLFLTSKNSLRWLSSEFTNAPVQHSYQFLKNQQHTPELKAVIERELINTKQAQASLF